MKSGGNVQVQGNSLDSWHYLEEKLNVFRADKLIISYSITDDGNGYFKISISGRKFDADLHTDFQKTMEVTINGYYREVTDYLIGDFQDSIDWYLEIIRNVATGKYAVVEYSRGGKVIYKRLMMNLRGKEVSIGDFKNHTKLFVKKTETVSGEL